MMSSKLRFLIELRMSAKSTDEKSRSTNSPPASTAVASLASDRLERQAAAAHRHIDGGGRVRLQHIAGLDRQQLDARDRRH